MELVKAHAYGNDFLKRLPRGVVGTLGSRSAERAARSTCGMPRGVGTSSPIEVVGRETLPSSSSPQGRASRDGRYAPRGLAHDRSVVPDGHLQRGADGPSRPAFAPTKRLPPPLLLDSTGDARRARRAEPSSLRPRLAPSRFRRRRTNRRGPGRRGSGPARRDGRRNRDSQRHARNGRFSSSPDSPAAPSPGGPLSRTGLGGPRPCPLDIRGRCSGTRLGPARGSCRGGFAPQGPSRTFSRDAAARRYGCLGAGGLRCPRPGG